MTQLLTCIFLGDVEACKSLLASHVDINQTQRDGTAPLHICASRGLLEITKLLVAQPGLRVNCELTRSDGTKRTPLQLAVEGGHTGIVALLLQKGATVSDECVKHAALRGHFAILQMLVDAGADINGALKDNTRKSLGSNKTLLFVAALRNDARCVRELLRLGADPSIKCGGMTPLQMARSKGYHDVVLALLDKKKQHPVPFEVIESSTWVAEKQKVPTGSALQKLGADLNGKGAEGNTPLHSAAEAGRLLAVDKLIKAGAHVNAIRDDGKTPLQLAIENDRSLVIRKLISYGGRVTCKPSQESSIGSGWMTAFMALQERK